MTSILDKKITQALRLMESASKIAQEHGQPLEIAYSGGKDSDVILELARMAGVTYRAIYKNTTIDPPGTISHAIRQGAEMLRPEYSFRQLIERNGFPHRLRRHCCRFLKEYKVLDYSVLGVRREESSRRAERYKEPEQCRVYGNGEKTRQYFPILDWTSEDIRLFAIRQGIRFHPLYYDADGNFHPERRLGCVGCPLKYRKTRLDDFRQHPGMVKLYLGGGKKFLLNHPDTKTARRFRDVYEWLTMDLFCDSFEQFEQTYRSNLFGNTDCKQLLEDYFGLDL